MRRVRRWGMVVAALVVACAMHRGIAGEFHVPFPDQLQVQAVPLAQASTEAEAWTRLWQPWFAERRRAAQGAEAGAVWSEAIALIRQAADGRVLPAVALAPAGDQLAGLRSDEARATAFAIARRMVDEPFGDRLRTAAPATAKVRSDAAAAAWALAIADAAGGAAQDAGFYRHLLAAGRWREDPETVALMEQCFLRDRRLTADWLALAMSSAPETWGVDTLRAVLRPEVETDEQRRAVLARAVDAALAPVLAPTARDLRVRLLLDLAGNEQGRWAGLLDGPTLDRIDGALATVEDLRFCALPWLVLLHADGDAARAVLARHASRIVAWSARLDAQGAPVFGYSVDPEIAQVKPWVTAMPALPLAMVACPLQEPDLAAISRFQAAGLESEGALIRGVQQVGPAEAATKAAFVALVAQDQERLARWWADAALRFDLTGDRMLKRCLAPWSFAQRATGPWLALPPTAKGTVPARQYASILRAGPSSEALTCLRTSFADRNPASFYYRLGVWSAATADPALAGELATFADAVPTTLDVHPLTHVADPGPAALLIDLHRATGRTAKALELAREAARLAHTARIAGQMTLVEREQPGLAAELRTAAAQVRLAGEPWEWDAIDARLLLLDPQGADLAPVLGAIAADHTPIGIFASWALAIVTGAEAGPLAAGDYLQAAQDHRFPSLLLTLAAVPERARPHLPTLADPRLMRGWCLGHPAHRWLGVRPTAEPIIDVLTAITIIRLSAARTAARPEQTVP